MLLQRPASQGRLPVVSLGGASCLRRAASLPLCRCVAAILPLASPFSSRFYCRLRFVWRQQTMVWWEQTMVWWEQTIVWRQQTISCPGVRPSCVHFRKKKSGAKAGENAAAARKNRSRRLAFSPRGRWKRCKTGCTSV